MLAELEHIYHNTQPIYVLFSLTTLKIIVESITSFLKVWNKTNFLLFFFIIDYVISLHCTILNEHLKIWVCSTSTVYTKITV